MACHLYFFHALSIMKLVEDFGVSFQTSRPFQFALFFFNHEDTSYVGKFLWEMFLYKQK